MGSKLNELLEGADMLNGQNNSNKQDNRSKYGEENYRNKSNEKSAKKKKQEEITGEEILNLKTEVREMLLEPIFPRVGITGLVGGSDTGKSAFLRQFTMAIVCKDEQFLGFLLKPKHNSAIYVATEDNVEAIKHLLQKQKEGKGYLKQQLRDLRFIFEFDNLPQRLTKSLEYKKADVIIIDAFADIYRGDLNQSNKVRDCLNEYQELANEYKCLIIFLHHTGKRTEEGEPSKNNVLGSQGFESKLRQVIELRLDSNQPELRHMCITKSNYLPYEYKNKSFVLQFDSYMLFTNTGLQKDYGELRISKNNNVSGKNADLEKYKQKEPSIVQEFIKLGKTQREVAEIVGISLGQVNKLSKQNIISPTKTEIVHVHEISLEKNREHEQTLMFCNEDNLVLPLSSDVIKRLAIEVLGQYVSRTDDNITRAIHFATQKELDWSKAVFRQMVEGSIILPTSNGKEYCLPT